MSKKIAVVSLGCDKNRVDTENMLWYLSGGDYVVTDDYSEAQIIIVNTCAFIETARKEAIDTILEMASYKQNGACEKLIVTGCLVVLNRKELEDGLPEVDAFLGIDEYEKIRYVIEGEGTAICQKCENRVLTTPLHYAYLRIADGCDNFCTFCTIPSIRGKYRSRRIEELVAEAQWLRDNGVKELILIAQDVTNYGKDIYGQPELIQLIKALSKIDFTWIRLMYCYPELVTDELLDEIESNPRVAKYIDIPMQHVSDKVLKRMGRRSNCRQLTDLCKKLRKRGIALRTTFMVGFPGEGNEEYDELLTFVDKYKPLNVGIFAYSKEEGTAAAKIKGGISRSEKLIRVQRLGRIHLANVTTLNMNSIGRVVDVIYEDIDYERGMFKGRTQYDAPDIDRSVYFKADYADVGEVYRVKITGFDDYDLIGEVVENEFTD